MAKHSDFKSLEKEWYNKLKESGFEDIEEKRDSGIYLKSWHNYCFQKEYCPEKAEAKQEYYRQASQFLEMHKFDSREEKKIWGLHCDGKSVREIGKMIGKYKTGVYQLIKQMTHKMNPALTKKLMIVRPMEAMDENLVFSTWLNGLRFGNELFRFIDKKPYYDNYRKVIEGILARPKTITLVACLKDDPETILGYMVKEGSNVVHYAYVKPQWRKLGILSELLPEGFGVVTHITIVGKAIITEKFPDVRYNPFIEVQS